MRGCSNARFSDFSYDIGALIRSSSPSGRSADALSTFELLSPTPALMSETGSSRARMLKIGHDRFAQPLLSIVTALIGFSVLLVGSFSRFGVTRQIIVAIILLVIIKALDSTMGGYALRSADLWPLVYVPAVVGFLTGAAILWLSERPGLFAQIFRRNRRLA